MKKWTSFNWFIVSKTGCVANMNHSFLVNMCFPFFSPVLKCHFPRVWPFILKWVLEWNVKQTIVPRSKGVSITRCVTRSQWEIFYHHIFHCKAVLMKEELKCSLYIHMSPTFEPLISCFIIQKYSKVKILILWSQSIKKSKTIQ